MAIRIRNENTGYGELARALISAPAYYGMGQRYRREQATDRAKDAASIRESIAEARKTQLEADALDEQAGYRSGLPQDLDILDAHRSGRSRVLPPPAAGSAGFPLEADINQSIRMNPDMFVSTGVPSASDANAAFANMLRAFGGNAEQMTGAMLDRQTGDLRAEAAGGARDAMGGRELIAAINSIAQGNQVQAPFSQSGGSVLNEFTGAVDQSSPMAQAGIAADQALADQRQRDSGTLTPQDKQYDALLKLNNALAAAGKQTMDEVTMRQIAADTLQTFNDPMGLTRVIYDPATQQVVATIDEKNGYQPFVPPADERAQGESGGGLLDFFGSLAGQGWDMVTGGDDAVQAEPSPVPPQAPGAGMWSPVLQRNVTEAEIAETARNRGVTPDEVRQRLGIQ